MLFEVVDLKIKLSVEGIHDVLYTCFCTCRIYNIIQVDFLTLKTLNPRLSFTLMKNSVIVYFQDII